MNETRMKMTCQEYNFENFEITEENKAAFNNIKDLIDGKNTNKVLFLYGETGTGKTHLLQAAANYLLLNSSNLSDSEILYIKADDFINELILSIGDNKSIQLKEKYNNLKFLFLDDVQDFYEKSVSQNILENIFDHIEINGGSIVFSADKIPGVSDRLKRRFLKGIVVKIERQYGKNEVIPVGDFLLGKIINVSNCNDVCEGSNHVLYPLDRAALDPMFRRPIVKRLTTGIRMIDSMLTVAKGQRLGVFYDSGAGKSELYEIISRTPDSDVNVFCFIGLRSYDVSDFINYELKQDVLQKSVIVIATDNSSAQDKINAAYMSTTIAEYFRDQNKDVVLFLDNMNRFESALTENNCPSDVSKKMINLMERAGPSDKGTITGFYSVLDVTGTMTDSLCNQIRGQADGHIVLRRSLAIKNKFPAIDLNNSVSRLAKRVTKNQLQFACKKVLEWISYYYDNKEFILSGKYQKGTCHEIDIAINKQEQINNFCNQDKSEFCEFSETERKLIALSEINPFDDFDICIFRDEFWKEEKNIKDILEGLQIIVIDYEKSVAEGLLSLEEDFDRIHHGFYKKGLRRVIDNCFDYDLAKEIADEKNKEIQFLNYFYYVAWNSIRYGADIYRNIKKFFPDSYSLRT